MNCFVYAGCKSANQKQTVEVRSFVIEKPFEFIILQFLFPCWLLLSQMYELFPSDSIQSR